MRLRRAAAALAALAVTVPVRAPAADPARQRIAVLDVRAVQGVGSGTATILTNIVVDEAARGGQDVISQADVAALLGFEKQRRILGCGDDSSCLAEIGGALGVEHVLTGQVGQIGTRFHLAFQLLDARKAKVIARVARFSERTEDALAAAAQRCVTDLLAAARGRGGPAGTPGSGVAAGVPLPPPPELSARPPAPQAAAPAAPPRPPAAVRPSRAGAWVALGAGVALLAGGAAFGLKAERERQDLRRSLADASYPSVYETKRRSVKDAALLSTVCWISGGASVAAAGWLFWRSRAPRVSVAPAVDEGGRLALVAGGTF